MSKSIRLHPKHGVNPTMCVCFFCGEDRGDLALLGAAYKTEAPRRMVIDSEPCAACQAEMARGITLIEGHDHAVQDCLQIGRDGPWLTGRWLVIKEEALTEAMLPDAEIRAAMFKTRKAFIDNEVYTRLMAGREP